MSDEERPIAEKEAPKEAEQVSKHATEPAQDAPLTKEEFAAEMHRLTARARAAGLNPLHTMARSYARQGILALEGLLASLDPDDSSKKKKRGRK